MAKYKNKVRGKKAKERGDEVENAFFSVLTRHDRENELAFDKTFPEAKILPQKKMVNGRFVTEKALTYTGVGGPDWIITLGTPLTGLSYGVSAWIETKHVSDSPNTAQMSRVHQYKDLLRNAEMNGISGYLVLWRVNASGTGKRAAIDEWRYHPVYAGGHKSVELGMVMKGKNIGKEYVSLKRIHGIIVPNCTGNLFDLIDESYFDDVWQKVVPEPDLIPVLKMLYFNGVKDE